MYESQGNLALKNRRPPSSRKAVLKPVQKRTIKTRRVMAAETPDFQQQLNTRKETIRRSLVRHRIRLMAMTVALVLLVAGVFGIIVYRQAMILEMNFHTVALERELENTLEESSQISEWLAQHTNLDLIRQQAMNRMGLQDPARSQIATVAIPDTDRIVFHHDDLTESEQDMYLSEVVAKIEAYFKTLTIDHRGE